MLRMELADIEETLMKMKIDLDYIEDDVKYSLLEDKI